MLKTPVPQAFKKKKKVDSFGYSGINTINLIFKDAAKKMPP